MIKNKTSTDLVLRHLKRKLQKQLHAFFYVYFSRVKTAQEKECKIFHILQ